MVEEAYACHRHSHSQLVAAVDDRLVPYRAAGLGDVFYAGLSRALDIVLKREERVRAEGDLRHLLVPLGLFLRREGRGLFGEILFPHIVFVKLLVIGADVEVYGVVRLALSDAIDKRQRGHFLVAAKPVIIRLVSGKARAVDARLLACSYADGLPAHSEANGV